MSKKKRYIFSDIKNYSETWFCKLILHLERLLSGTYFTAVTSLSNNSYLQIDSIVFFIIIIFTAGESRFSFLLQ